MDELDDTITNQSSTVSSSAPGRFRTAAQGLGPFMLVLVLSTLAASCGSNHAQIVPAHPPASHELSPDRATHPQVEQAVAVIRDAMSFAIGPVGEGGDRPPEVDAFAEILAHDQAAQYFLQLVSGATPAGRAYALCGLWLTDQAAYSSTVSSFADSLERVKYNLGGCIYEVVPFRDLVATTRPVMDISSGGLPIALKAYALEAP